MKTSKTLNQNGKTKPERWRVLAEQYAADRAAATTSHKAARAAYIDAEARYQNAQTAQAIVPTVAEAVQQTAHDRVAAVVSTSLEMVFGTKYDFRINFVQARGKTEARLVFVDDGEELHPMTASGGGVVDVAAFALRTSCLMLTRPPLRRVLIMDEPFKFVSADKRPLIREMLAYLSRELEIQFIIVTHIPELLCGTVVELK